MPAAADPVKGDPLVSSYFVVDFGSHIKNSIFNEVSGISVEIEVAEHKVMSAKAQQVVRKIPGRTKWGDITLKRGITANMDVYKWRQEVEEGKVDKARVNGTIKLYSHAGVDVVAEWHVYDAWPSKISGPNLKTDSNDVGMEEITIVYEGIERKK